MGTRLNQAGEHAGNDCAFSLYVVEDFFREVADFMCNDGLCQNPCNRSFGHIEKFDRLPVGVKFVTSLPRQIRFEPLF